MRLEADHECPVRADPAMLERVLHNLLGNATHHIGADGVFILRCIPQAGGCRVEVEDHGPGISPEDLPYIFDRVLPFPARTPAKPAPAWAFRSPRRSCSSTASPFGVQSEVGKGSVFWFEAKAPGPQAP